VKRHVDDLAIFGGQPAFLYPLFVGRPNKFDRTRLFDRLNWALDNEWLTNGGPLTSEFEHCVAELAGVRHCVATCNATAGLQLLAHATGLTGEVVMPSLTFVATAHSMRWLGLEPVFCDVDPRTGCIDVASAEATSITERTSAIIGVHLWGQSCAVVELEKLAADKGIALFFDAAHALGCTSFGRAIGGFGDAEVFSFHATKVVSAFEGGAIVSDDDELAHRVRALRNFGIGLTGGNAAGGTNAKMCEASAAMGLTSLEAFADAVEWNRANYESYRSELEGLPGVRIVEMPETERNNYQYVIVEIDNEVSGMGRDLLMQLLRAEQVTAKPYFSPACHEQEPYRSRGRVELPHTERLSARVLALPTGTGVSSEDIRRICNVVRLAASNGPEITARWQRTNPHRTAEAGA